MSVIVRAVAVALLLAACGGGGEDAAQAQGAAPSGPGVETRAPNAAGQRPAFKGQTRAPAVKTPFAYDTEVMAEGLDHPWSLIFLPNGQLLVTEKSGTMRFVGRERLMSNPVSGFPPVDARDQGGLLDVAIDPLYRGTQIIYWSYAEPHPDGTTNTAVATGKLVGGPAPRIDNAKVIYRQSPAMASTKHYGSRLVWDQAGNLFVTQGERSIMPGRMQAQKPDSLLGKVVRIKPDGSVPADNPFVGKAGWRPEIWSHGHRNVQAAALNPKTGELWTVEHGAKGGDELNIVRKGRDYGWPTITYGEDYSGLPIGVGITARAGMEQPIYYWDPVIAPSGMAFYTDTRVPEWTGNLFIGALAGQHLVRLVLNGDRVVGEERLLTDVGARIRDVRQGPDGFIWVVTDGPDAKVLRIVPRR